VLDDLKRGFKCALLGFMVSVILLGIPYVYLYGSILHYKPYEVNSIHYRAEDNHLDITVGFTKLDCEFDSLDVFGYYLGEWFLIPWSNTLDNDHVGDRIAGECTLRITTGHLERDYSIVEVRTRHMCGNAGEGPVVDQIMVRIDLDQRHE
jgi:hypothetical protein